MTDVAVYNAGKSSFTLQEGELKPGKTIMLSPAKAEKLVNNYKDLVYQGDTISSVENTALLERATNLEKSLNKQAEELGELRIEKTELVKTSESLQKEVNELGKQLADTQKENIELAKKLTSVQKENGELTKKLAKATKADKKTDDIPPEKDDKDEL